MTITSRSAFLINACLAGGLSASLPTQAMELTDNFEFSGFARIAAGYLDSDDKYLDGYTNDISATQQSLIAIQPTYHFTDSLSLTSQLIAHSSEDRDSGVEWLYMSYRPSSAWHIRAGRLRMPFFYYSDSVDVGYSYPWMTPPLQVYNNYLFSTFDGVSASYFYSGPGFGLYLEGYYGNYEGDLYLAGGKIDVDAKLTDMTGLVMMLQRNNVALRLSYHSGFNRTTITQLEPLINTLRQYNFNDSADSLGSDGDVQTWQVSLSYDTPLSFYRAEWVHTRTPFDLASNFSGYYAMAGRNIQDWSVFLTLAGTEYKDVNPERELPPPSNPPATELDQLSAAYYSVFDRTPNGTINSISLGTRWDFRPQMALKAEIGYYEENSERSGYFDTPTSGSYLNGSDPEKERATLYQVGWEWIF